MLLLFCVTHRQMLLKSGSSYCINEKTLLYCISLLRALFDPDVVHNSLVSRAINKCCTILHIRPKLCSKALDLCSTTPMNSRANRELCGHVNQALTYSITFNVTEILKMHHKLKNKLMHVIYLHYSRGIPLIPGSGVP